MMRARLRGRLGAGRPRAVHAGGRARRDGRRAQGRAADAARARDDAGGGRGRQARARSSPTSTARTGGCASTRSAARTAGCSRPRARSTRSTRRSARSASASRVVALLGVAAALGLARLATRAAVKPVAELTGAAEHVARTRDLTRRIDHEGDDELSRLAGAFNTMLEALEASQRAQRRLVADASHELRTPLTSLRTNLEVLGRAGLPERDHARLRADVIAQLEELTLLVSDLVELAREDEPAAEREALRLDELVAAAVQRAARHAPGRAVRDRAGARRRRRRARPAGPRRRQPARQRGQVQRAGRHGRGDAAAGGRAGGARPRAGHRRRGSAVRLRPLLPRPLRPRAAGLRAGARDRAPGGRGARRHAWPPPARRTAAPCCGWRFQQAPNRVSPGSQAARAPWRATRWKGAR